MHLGTREGEGGGGGSDNDFLLHLDVRAQVQIDIKLRARTRNAGSPFVSVRLSIHHGWEMNNGPEENPPTPLVAEWGALERASGNQKKRRKANMST